jgi:hypothetical protein
MDGGGQVAVGGTDALTLEDAIAGLYQRAGVPPHRLVKGDHQSVRQGHGGDGGGGGVFLVGLRLDATMELEEFAQHVRSARACEGRDLPPCDCERGERGVVSS